VRKKQMTHTGVTFKIPDRYEFVGPRLEGGQGYVYIYKDTFLQRNVAIKEMKHPGDAVALRDELARIREIRSRHVVEVYDLFEAKQSTNVALVEEYVPGPTLEDLAKSQPPLSQNQVIKILWQIACGLADVHAHNIIHRDIKPRNIKQDDEGVVKVLDFGLSSILVPGAETNAARGTTHYLAPEMFDNPPIPLNNEIDVYAFGVTVWYFLNGGMLPKALKEVPPQTGSLTRSLQGAKIVLPNRLTDLLDRTIDLNPSNRPRMSLIRDFLHEQLTSGQHRLVFFHNGKQQILSKDNPRVTLRAGNSSLTIYYDQFNFVVEMVEGDVYSNNTNAAVGMALPSSFVITFGDSSEGPGRTFVPMNVMVPEVVL
jgi:eukaryotic-like serine/threonine-protein kinase